MLFISIHAYPERQYPYFSGYVDEQGAEAGLGYTLNIPLDAGVTDQQYLAALEGAWRRSEISPRRLWRSRPGSIRSGMTRSAISR